MKAILFLFTLLFFASLISGQAPNTWTQKADFGGVARAGAAGFTLDGKGYVGTGSQYPISYKDFWAYDPVNDSWTQKADFGGAARMYAVSFAINGKGYLGTGQSGTFPNYNYHKDFWEYNADANTWIKKTDFGGTARYGASGFSIDGFGYLGTGSSTLSGLDKDFWKYDPANDTWTQMAQFEGDARKWAVGFALGNKGYLGTGGSNVTKKDLWEYDPATDSWTQRADFGGAPRNAATVFTIGNVGYVGIGAMNTPYKDFWKYDPTTDTWSQIQDFGGTARGEAYGFSIGNKGYVGTGNTWPSFKKDFWEYTSDATASECTTPVNLTSDNVNSFTVKLKWQPVGGAIGYRIAYKATGSSNAVVIFSKDNHEVLMGLIPNTNYTWRVKTFCSKEPKVTSPWSENQFFTTDPLRIVDGTNHESLIEVYPNPVSQSSTVTFFLNEASPALIEILDVNGKSVKVIANKVFSSGNHEVSFNRELIGAGIYFLQLKSNERVMMKKVVVE